MATSIFGTFPILNFKKSQTDQYGFDYVSYQYTIKTSTLDNYNIKKDDIFDGIENWRGISWAKSASPGLLYVVDTIETTNIPGGLTELMINTVGTKNILNPPRVLLFSGGPLIFGLLGTQPSDEIYGHGTSDVGQTIEVKFLASGGAAGQAAVFTTYSSSIMPTVLNGISLPSPARSAGSFNNVQLIEDGSGSILYGSVGEYYGFVCKKVLTEKRGSLLLVTLVFSEAGFANKYQRTALVNIYNFPIIG
jgi:hypothetical protein